MGNMEKVLQALEHCDLCSDMPNCPGCAYLREPDCMEHLKRDIIALLKAQEAVKPSFRRGDAYCGNCGCNLRNLYGESNYCMHCGKKAKWG